MELDDLKSTWKKTTTPEQPITAIIEMLKAHKHPVLKKIRAQLMIQAIGWTVFIIVAYSMFDAEKKPIWINLLALITTLLPILHHIFGYQLSKKPIVGPNLRLSLQHYIAQVKKYAIVNVGVRMLLLAGILLFFTYGLELNTAKIYSIVAILAIFIFQLTLLAMIWKKRISSLQTTLIDLTA